MGILIKLKVKLVSVIWFDKTVYKNSINIDCSWRS